jgi:hypothetical protein
VALLGLIAIRFPGQTLQWDDKAMRFTNNEMANGYVRSSYREGWSFDERLEATASLILNP